MIGAFLLLAAAGGDCFAAARDVAAGTLLSARDLKPVACAAEAPRAPLRYDASAGAPVAVAAISAGTYLGRLAPVPERQVAPGDMLTLRASAGVVTIERQVTAMQAGRSGGRVFVRDSAGRIFAVPLALDGR